MPEKPVICRLTLELLWTAIFIGVLGLGVPILLYFQPPPTSPRNLVIMGVCFFFAPVLPALWFHVRCRLIADGNSLEIRGLFYTRKVAWNQIRDFYLQIPPPNHKTKIPLAYIEFGTRKQLLSQNFKNLSELKERIEAKATNTRSRKFEIKEMRALDETPQIFDYGNPQAWPLILLAIFLGLYTFGNIYGKTLLQSGFSGLIASFAIYSLPMKLGMIGTSLIIIGLYPLVALIGVPAVKASQKFRGQQIIASAQGVEWRSGASKIEIPWEQIETYHLESVKGLLQRPLCVVQSKRDRITFLSSLPKSYILRSIIEQKSVNSTTDSWQFLAGQDEDILGRAAIPDSDGKIIFHYKNRTNRAMLLGGSVLCLVTIGLSHFGNPALKQQDSSALFMSIMLGIPTFYGWLAYFFSRVEIERDGLRHITAFKRRFIAWNEITKLKSSTFYWITSDKKLIRITQFLSEPKHFQNTVAERSGKTWETPEGKNEFLIGH